jgi:hypothetical protein
MTDAHSILSKTHVLHFQKLIKVMEDKPAVWRLLKKQHCQVM